MTIRGPEGTIWEKPQEAPGLHYTLDVKTPGDFDVWMFLKYDNRGADKIAVAVDGQVFDIKTYTNRRGLFSYYSISVWHWNQLTTVHLEPGVHRFSILGVSAKVAIDRIFLTKNDERPPVDSDWTCNLDCI